MEELDQFELSILRDYLGDSWGQFEEFCEERGGKSAIAGDIYRKLGGEEE